MFALLGPLLSIVTSLFGGISGGVLAVLESLAGKPRRAILCSDSGNVGLDNHR